VKGNAARNYHLPSLNDLYWQPGGNPDLLPEKGFSSEVGTEYRLDLKQLSLETELTFFRSDIKDWIIWIPSYKGYWEPRNIKNVLSKGLELSAGLKGDDGAFKYRISGTYTFTRSLNYGDREIWGDESYGKQLVYVPLHSGNIYVNAEHKGYTVSWQYNAFSERYTTSSNDVTRRDWLYPYYMNDLSFGKEFPLKTLTFSAQFRIYNLFNETYHSVLYRPMPGRNFMLVLMVRM
jgi:iron complex outermembrane receptor protein